MDVTLRRTLPTMIDHAVRARLQAFVASGEMKTCFGCGAPTDCQTVGCRHCQNRRRQARRYWHPRNDAERRLIELQCGNNRRR